MLNVKTKKEEYAVAAVPLTEQQLDCLVQQTVSESRIWFDEPRNWLTYGGFLGFHIHRAVFQYQLGYAEDASYDPRIVDNFVSACYNLAMSEGYPL